MSILKQQQINLSGIRKAQYAFADEFATFPTPTDGVVNTSNIVFNPGGAWKDLYFTPGTIKPAVKQQQTDAGDLFQISVKLNYPRDSAQATNSFVLLSRRPSILLLEDNNGTRVVYGELNAPLRAVFDIVKDPQPGGANHYDVEIAGKTLFPPSYIVT